MAAGDAPCVSVVIICYNHGAFLSDAIESVLSQTMPDFEVVLVDDGSTDDTPRVAATFPDVRYFRQANRGMGAARNTGFARSRGRYVVFLDADDRLLPNALTAGLRSMKEHPECAFVSGHYRMVAADGSPMRSPVVSCVTENHYGRLLEGNYIGMHATVMFDRTALDRVGGPVRRRRASDDYDIYLRIARRSPVFCHDEVVAEYRWHGSNLSLDYAAMLDTTLGILRAQRRWARATPQLAASYRAGIRRWRELYSDRLVHQVIGQMRSPSRWLSALRGAVVLLRRDPAAFARYLRRRSGR